VLGGEGDGEGAGGGEAEEVGAGPGEGCEELEELVVEEGLGGGEQRGEERPWPQRSKRRRWVSTGGEGAAGRERMALAMGRRLMQGVEPPCMRIARRMLGGSGTTCGEEETVLEGVLERR
jgi:hypothetical protein